MPDSRRALIGTVAVRPVSNRPVGTVTRGTTNPNRLRRVDRWLAGPQAGRLRGGAPVVVDLGYGAYPVTSLEMLQRLRPVNPQVRLLGIEIDPERVAAAQHLANDDVVFVRGGFELPRPTGWAAPSVVRAFNVLRQYDEAEVPAAWDLLCRGLGPDGLLVDGTCDEVGRRCTWVALDRSGPLSLTISLKLDAIERPSDVAERLPKALIHHNVPGERVHDWLQALDRAWEVHAPLRVHGARQRWLATVSTVKQEGWPVLHGPTRWRLGEVGIPWRCVNAD
ncbi:class I SAM-dependent methyltransferase [Luteococcus sanguinis]|uniref:Class I SAM-dependent methyltransferase n=1 Tax=Luteococcus sanguinis TaxID=174038 RepID=A0ABW1WXB3_9ACTN